MARGALRRSQKGGQTPTWSDPVARGRAAAHNAGGRAPSDEPDPLQEREAPGSHQGRARGRRVRARRGRPHPRGLAAGDPRGRRGRRRRGRPDAHARADRLPRPRVPAGGQHPRAGGGAPHPPDRAGRPAHARHARPGFHDGPGHGRRRLGDPGGRRARLPRRAAALHRRPRDRPDQRAQRPAPPDRSRGRVPDGERDGLHPRDRRRRDRGAAGRPRAAAPGRRPHQDHGVGRRRLALRPPRQPPVLDRRDPRRRRGGRRLQALRVRPLLPGERDRAGRRVRRAGHRARQPDRRAHGEAHGEEGRVPRPDAGRLRRHQPPRGPVRDGPGEPREEQARARGGPALPRARQAGRGPDGLRVGPPRPAPARPVEGVPPAGRSPESRGRSSTRRPSSAPSCSAARASSA